MVLGGDHDVLGSCAFGDRHPLVSVELDRVELPGQRLVFGDGNLSAVHDPFAESGDGFAFPLAGRHGIESPMDEHAEAGLAPPLQTLFSGRVGGWLGGREAYRHQDQGGWQAL